MSSVPKLNRFPALDTSARSRSDALAVTGLTVAYRTRTGEREALHDITLRVAQGEAYGLVGESGCGKSTLAFATLGYLADNAQVKAGRIAVNGAEIAALDAEALRTLRAKTVSMVYQDPSRALNPSLTVGVQLSEAFETAAGLARGAARDQALDMLERVRIAAPLEAMSRYPHQLSGGMQQRVVIAMALASNPALLVLDEPTTGLDATVQADILDLVAQLREQTGMAVLFISHDLAVVGQVCSRIGVLYAGRLVEEGATADVFGAPHHPYTVGLLRCLPARSSGKRLARLDTIEGLPPASGAVPRGCVFAPRCALADDRCRREPPPPHRFTMPGGVQMARCHYHEQARALPHRPNSSEGRTLRADASLRPARLLHASHLSKTFASEHGSVRAVHDVSLTLGEGETLGLVGESGSGKTTLAKLIAGLLPPDAGGSIELDGKPLPARVERRSHDQVKSLQFVFQHADSALNRAHPVARLIGRALTKLAALRGTERDARLAALLTDLRLPTDYLDARTRQLSGGLKQRVAIARAFAGDPRIVVCDEPTSSLDVSVQASILNLLVDLQREHGTSYLFVSHDLHVVRYVSDRIAVMYLGRLLEIGATGSIFEGPCHPYTEALISAMPSAMPGETGERPPRVRLLGEPPSASDAPSGCVFHTRCPRKLGAICEDCAPPFADAGDGHLIRCHIPISDLTAIRHQAPRPAGRL